jgi:hypothetical protein
VEGDKKSNDFPSTVPGFDPRKENRISQFWPSFEFCTILNHTSKSIFCMVFDKFSCIFHDICPSFVDSIESNMSKRAAFGEASHESISRLKFY